MSKPREPAPTPAEPVAPPPAPETTAPAETAAADELTTLRQEIEALRDRNLRLTAELQNQQKRAQREKQEALRYAEAEFARELLPVLDDFERTVAAADTAPDARTVADGVRIVQQQLLKVLASRGIAPIQAAGRPFNPDEHEALMQQPSDQPAGTVLYEAARGYRMHERVLRPARVVVAGSPEAAAAEPGA